MDSGHRKPYRPNRVWDRAPSKFLETLKMQDRKMQDQLTGMKNGGP